jgi:hypothetical protein
LTKTVDAGYGLAKGSAKVDEIDLELIEPSHLILLPILSTIFLFIKLIWFIVVFVRANPVFSFCIISFICYSDAVIESDVIYNEATMWAPYYYPPCR